MLVHNTLVGVNLRDQIKIGASAKIVTGFDIARTIAMGADWCNAARGFMFALGCLQRPATRVTAHWRDHAGPQTHARPGARQGRARVSISPEHDGST